MAHNLLPGFHSLRFMVQLVTKLCYRRKPSVDCYCWSKPTMGCCSLATQKLFHLTNVQKLIETNQQQNKITFVGEPVKYALTISN